MTKTISMKRPATTGCNSLQICTCICSWELHIEWAFETLTAIGKHNLETKLVKLTDKTLMTNGSPALWPSNSYKVAFEYRIEGS